ncbi:MAG: PKD domain-containing protein [Myxococcaceae bacterium]|nr:PKD domain-containing protein [Myxococcaceae bacterium]
MRTSLVVAFTLISAEAFANAGGITGRSGKQTTTCSGCHMQGGNTATLTVTGPTTVVAGTAGNYTIELSGGPGAYGGTNIATDVGTLGIRNSTLRYYMPVNELAQSDKRAFTAGKVSWDFRWTAPTTPGPAKIWVAAQSVDNNGQPTNDREAKTVIDITVVAPNLAPTVATAAASTPATPTTLNLSVLGADDAGAANLVYTWSATGPAPVAFSVNASNAARNTVATFTRAGAYVFTARIADVPGLFVTSVVNVTVAQAYTTLRVSPPTQTLALGSSLQLSAGALDQFGQTMTTPAITWSAAAGTITAGGLYTTPTAAGGPHTITATAGGKSGTSAVTIVTGQPPRVMTPAARLVLTNKTVQLTVLGADDGGESLLRYTWAATGPGAVTFAPNGTNAAKSTVATLTRAGQHTFTVTIRDGAGLTVTSSVNATIEPELLGLAVTPATLTVRPAAQAQLSASATDQFGRPMTSSGTASWVSFGGGTVSSTGMFQAGSTLGGPFQVRATLAGKTATADVTVANGGLPVILGVPTSSPAAVLGRTARLRVVADDDSGEAGLSYRWEWAAGPAPVTFAPNGSNAAQNATATFEQAGTYTLTVTVTNAAGRSSSADVNVEVIASADRIKVVPDAVILRANATQAFTAVLLDQFGDETSGAGAVDWATPNAGQIDGSGVLRAVGTPGRYTVTAVANGLRGQAQVTIDGAAPTVKLTSPDPMKVLTGEARLMADATDDDVLAQVRFYVDGELIGAATAVPYEITWNSAAVPDGRRDVHLEAEDMAGNVTSSDPVKVIVWNDMSKPAPGEAVVQGQGCSAASGVPLLALLTLILRRLGFRRGTTVSPKVSRDGDTRLIPALNPARLRRGPTGMRAAQRAPRRSLMSRTTLAFAVLLSSVASAQALTQEQRERCATRLSINVLGQSPSAALMSATDPRAEVPAMLQSTVFIDRFAAFIQARFSPEPNRFAAEDTPYYLTQKILTEGKPWADLFVGPYVFTRKMNDQNGTLPPVITEAPEGFGYTQSTDWRRRYAGNELQGYRLVHAYRLINNVLGMELKAALNTDGISAEGRKSSSCSGCHYHPIFGLDLVARVLPLRGRTTPADVPQTLLGGKVISSEKELLQAMVDSPDFKFNVCRTAMRYAYGRAEYKCEGPVFDACMAAFNTTPTMQAALSSILRHPTYCQ